VCDVLMVFGTSTRIHLGRLRTFVSGWWNRSSERKYLVSAKICLKRQMCSVKPLRAFGGKLRRPTRTKIVISQERQHYFSGIFCTYRHIGLFNYDPTAHRVPWFCSLYWWCLSALFLHVALGPCSL